MSIRLSTIALELDAFNLIERLPENPLVYIRGGEGLVGWGEALRIEATAQFAALVMSLMITASLRPAPKSRGFEKNLSCDTWV